MTRQPDCTIHVWIDEKQLRWIVEYQHTGDGGSHLFAASHDKPGQVAAIWLEFVNEAKKFLAAFSKTY